MSFACNEKQILAEEKDYGVLILRENLTRCIIAGVLKLW